jgi:hypothetical protein
MAENCQEPASGNGRRRRRQHARFAGEQRCVTGDDTKMRHAPDGVHRGVAVGTAVGTELEPAGDAAVRLKANAARLAIADHALPRKPWQT